MTFSFIMALLAGYTFRCFVESKSCTHDWEHVSTTSIRKAWAPEYVHHSIRNYQCKKCLKGKNVRIGVQ